MIFGSRGPSIVRCFTKMWLALVLVLLCPVAAHDCIHDKLQLTADQLAAGPSVQDYGFGGMRHVHRKRQVVDAAPLRVLFDKDVLHTHNNTCKSGKASVHIGVPIPCNERTNFEGDVVQLVERVLTRLETFIANMLSTVPVRGFLSVTTPRCGFFDPPRTTKYQPGTTRTKADIVVFVTSWPTHGSTAAWAGACQHDQFGRPIAGQINFGINAIKGKSDDYVFGIALHELLHVLGFNGERMKTFLDRETGEFIPATTTMVNVTLFESVGKPKQTTLLRSPAVLDAARNYFACDSMQGLEIEDAWGKPAGSGGSHWEIRVVDEEVMNPVSHLEWFLSNFTLAYFYDMGVYNVNWKLAEQEPITYQSGCARVLEHCTTWPGTQAACHQATKAPTQCNILRTGTGACGMLKYSSCVPPFMQTTEKCDVTGLPMNDGCAHPRTFTTGLCTDESKMSTSGSSIVTVGHSFGTHSRCMASSASGPNSKRSRVLGCFNVICPYNGGVSPDAGMAVPVNAPMTPAGSPVPAPSPFPVRPPTSPVVTPTNAPSKGFMLTPRPTPKPVDPSSLLHRCLNEGTTCESCTAVDETCQWCERTSTCDKVSSCHYSELVSRNYRWCPATPPLSECEALANDCAACTANSKCHWCDYNFGESGSRCTHAQCYRSHMTVTDAAQCPGKPTAPKIYGSCTFAGVAGKCVDFNDCVVGTSVGALSGAEGCHGVGNDDVQCCIPAPNLGGTKKKREYHDGAEQRGNVLDRVADEKHGANREDERKRKVEQAAEQDETRQEQVKNGIFHVQVGKSVFECKSGTTITLSGGFGGEEWQGELDCPPFEEVCCAQPCGEHGTCQFGKCICNPGWFGAVCDVEVEPENFHLADRKTWKTKQIKLADPVDFNPYGDNSDEVMPMEVDFANPTSESPDQGSSGTTPSPPSSSPAAVVITSLWRHLVVALLVVTLIGSA